MRRPLLTPPTAPPAAPPTSRPVRLSTRPPHERPGPGPWRLALLLALGLVFWLGALQLRTPDPAPASAPDTDFSAARALTDLQAIATEPRPIGSAANARVRQYLIDQIRALGLEPAVQTTSQVVSEGEEGFRAGVVTNVIARVPGTASTGAIAINAHYDGANTGPAASDCGSCVVTALETLRAVRAGAPLKNDLLFVFVDGEEQHMMGSAAFTDQHPWAADVRLTLNYEATGSGGPAFLYATSPDNNALVREFLRVAPHPSAYSLLVAINALYREGRFDSDLGEYTERGSAGLGFLYAADATAYHSTRDSVANIDPGSIQQEGGVTLALVRHFGDRDLAALPRDGDRVFFTILPGVVAHYAARWAAPLAALLTGALIALVVVGVRQRALSGRGLVAGVGVALGGLIGAVVGAELLWAALRALQPDYGAPMIGHYQTTLHVAILALATIAVLAMLPALLGRQLRPLNLMVGALLAALPALWLTSVAAPGASYLVTWPLAGALLPSGWALLARGRATRPAARWAMLVLAATPALLILPGTLYQMVALAVRFEGILGAPVLGVVMLFVAPLVLLAVPHLHFLGAGSGARDRWAVPASAALATVALAVWAVTTAGFDAAHPRPDQLSYRLDADNGTAQWVSFGRRLDHWTAQFFPAGGERRTVDTVAQGAVTAFVAPAPVAALPAPTVTVLSDERTDAGRMLRLRLASPRGVTAMTTAVEAAGAITAASVAGQTVDLSAYAPAADGRLHLTYANATPAGWELSLTVGTSEPITLLFEETTDGLPALPAFNAPTRPADTMPAPLFAPDATVVTRRVQV